MRRITDKHLYASTGTPDNGNIVSAGEKPLPLPLNVI